MSYFFFFFFFQAEDGIRDIGVTGVQTCALPNLRGHDEEKIEGWIEARNIMPDKVLENARKLAEEDKETQAQATGQRSEERRVGKECRSRWSPNDEKKKRREAEERMSNREITDRK